MKSESLIITIAILFVGIMILKSILSSVENNIQESQNNAEENIVEDTQEYDNVIVQNAVDISVFEELK